MLVPMRELLLEAARGGYAVGSFDAGNLESAEGVLEAAVENNAPIILAIAEAFFKDVRFETLVHAVREEALPLKVPVAIILDHGKSFESCVRAIQAGVTSVMFDGSSLPYEENVRISKQMVSVAKAVGVSTEAEIGHVGQGWEYEKTEETLTTPEEAVRFVEETGVDSLAVAVGTAHGKYKGEPKIDFERLAAIHEAVKLPLVLHGGSSTGDERLKKSIDYGIAKVNIYTDMSAEAVARIKKLLEEKPDNVRMNPLVQTTRAAFRDVAGHYIRLFGSANRA
ncbi:MAG TPA: class II fructose-bisphosphate aldolase [Chloroflexota bacterium]